MFDSQFRCYTERLCGEFCQLILHQLPVGLAELDRFMRPTHPFL